MKSSKLAATALLLVLSAIVGASCATNASPTDGLATEDDLELALQVLLDDWRRSYDVAGVTMALGLQGQEPWVGASGVSSLEVGTPLGPGDRFRIGSITKTFVAVVVLQLVKEGVLELDAPIEDYVPGFPNGEKIAVRQLLNHTSGTYNYTEHRVFEDLRATDRDWGPEEVVALATAQEPNFEPGTDWAYSNTGYILLGMAVEAATGSAIHAELRRRIFEPLHLTDTFYAGAEEVPGGFVHGYMDIDGDGTIDDVERIADAGINASAGADGAMVSNVEDLVRFANALMGDELLDEAQRNEMFRIGEPNRGYGLGVQYLTPLFSLPPVADTGPMWGHSGGIPGFESLLVYLPDHGVALAVLTNEQGGPSDRLISLADSAIDAVFGLSR